MEPLRSKRKCESARKYLSLAFETGVFKAALEISDSSRIAQGIFGKMNLRKAEVSLVDDNGAAFPVLLTNVQFELDYCLETPNDVYLVEAKRGNSTSFSLLQLFYPSVVVRDSVKQCGKMLHTLLVRVVAKSPVEVRYLFYEYRFLNPLVANQVEIQRSSRVVLQIEDF